MRRRSVVSKLSLVAVAGAIGYAAPAHAQPPPPGPSWNCAVYQNIYPGTHHTVVLEQRVYHCKQGGVREAFVGEDLYFARGSRTLKAVHKNVTQCRARDHTLSNCVRDYTFRFRNPRGRQNWWVNCHVVWTGIFGKTGEYAWSLRVRL